MESYREFWRELEPDDDKSLNNKTAEEYPVQEQEINENDKENKLSEADKNADSEEREYEEIDRETIVDAVLSGFPAKDINGLDYAVNNTIKRIGIKENYPAFERIKEEIKILVELRRRVIRDSNRNHIENDKERRQERSFKEKYGYSAKNTPGQKILQEADNIKKDISSRPNDIEEQQAWTEKEAKREMNLADAEFIKGIAAHVEEYPEYATPFWADFKKIFNQEKRREKHYRNGQMNTAEKIKSGVLGELAGKKLFENTRDQLLENKGSFITGFKNLHIKIMESDSKQDVFSMSDLFIEVNDNGHISRLPVQVKCAYIGDAEKYKENFVKNNICTIQYYNEDENEYVKNENPLARERSRFFKEKEAGVFVILPRGSKDFDIDDTGVATEELRKSFNQELRRELTLYLTRKRTAA